MAHLFAVFFFPMVADWSTGERKHVFYQCYRKYYEQIVAGAATVDFVWLVTESGCEQSRIDVCVMMFKHQTAIEFGPSVTVSCYCACIVHVFVLNTNSSLRSLEMVSKMISRSTNDSFAIDPQTSVKKNNRFFKGLKR